MYCLAINKLKFIPILVIFNLLEIFLIWIYHDTLLQVIMILLGLLIALTVVLFIYVGVTKDV
jgi:hypothetical protein